MSDTKQATTCPTCGSDDPAKRGTPWSYSLKECTDSFHSAHPVSAQTPTDHRVEAIKRDWLAREEAEDGQGYDRFARCPECGHATVGLSPPFYINHAPECSRPRGAPWPDPPSEVKRLADELAAAEARAAEVEQKLAATEKWGEEGWAWLEEALDALGVETVFDIPKHPQDEDG